MGYLREIRMRVMKISMMFVEMYRDLSSRLHKTRKEYSVQHFETSSANQRIVPNSFIMEGHRLHLFISNKSGSDHGATELHRYVRDSGNRIEEA